jgi:N-acetylglucosamine malate deacetylase 2
MDTIVAIFPHPDDDAYGMGGTLLLMKERFRLHSLCLTKGERGLSPDPRAQTAATRQKEEEACCRLLGAELEFLEQIDGEVFAGREICERVAARLKDLHPRAVLTTFPMEHHPDHAATAEIAVKALRLAGLYDTVEVYQAEEGAGTQTICFDPHLYVDITSVFEKKKELLRCHACQNLDGCMIEAVTAQNRLRGDMARCNYAEAWRSYFPLVNWRHGRRPVPVLLEL